MWHHNKDSNSIDITGHDFAATKKYRDVAATGTAAIVVDDSARRRSPPAAGLHPPQVNDLVRPRPELSAGVWRARGCRVPVSW
jgi:hypothetical protein